GSTEFRTGLITSAYDWYLDREPDAAGLKYWLDQMAKGVTIAQIESGFLASAEYRALAGDAATWVVYLYLDVLDREPSDAEVAYWVGRLAKGTNPRDVALGFLLSTEYLTTVVGGYYDWLLGRPLDPTGTKTWVGILQKGGRDEWIIGGIVASDEYWKLVTT
ncbi:MAG TPA: DUF4214 domain-containing protein, partial [Actinotalea sp.]|nr:DUF4214 domain-containing protein [Actinotalea sp.]